MNEIDLKKLKEELCKYFFRLEGQERRYKVDLGYEYEERVEIYPENYIEFNKHYAPNYEILPELSKLLRSNYE